MPSLRPSEHPNKEPSFSGISSAQLAMYVGLTSLSVFFAGSLVAFFITRAQAVAWRGAEAPSLPWGLWLSTALLFALSGCLHFAQKKLSHNHLLDVTRGLQGALLFAVGFLGLQAVNWRVMAEAHLTVEMRSLYAFTFYALTALHALHVLFGLVPLLVVISRSKRDHYSSSRDEGVRLLRQYWDFLLVVWLILLFSLWFS